MGTIIALLILVLLITAAILITILERKKHKGCAFCPYNGSCEKNNNSKCNKTKNAYQKE